MEFNIMMSPDFYSRIRLPYSQIIQSLNFLFNNENDGETTARLNCQFLTPDRSNIIFGSPLIDSKNLNYLIEKQSHLPRLSTNHLNSQVISDQLLSNYYAMSVATATNNNHALHGQMAGPAKLQPRKKFTNDYSISLSKEENEYLFTLLGDRCVTLATAVIQLFLSEQPNHTRWRKKLTGVACFVKDNSRRNYFIRVYDLDHAQTCVWQQELYFTFQYRCPRPYFHTFEADNCMAALNFATDKEADGFRRVVLEKVNTMNQKHQEKKKAQQQRLNAVNQPSFSVPTLGSLSIGSGSYSNASTKERKKNKKDKKEKKKYCKEDIGLPTNFQHLHHVGWNSAGTIDFQLKQVLEEAGVSTHQYKNPETKQFIDNFVQQYTQTTNPELGRPKENTAADYSSNQLPNYGNSSYNGGAYLQPLRYNSQKSNGPPPLPQTQPTYTYYSTNQRTNAENSNLSNNLSNNVNSQTYVSKPVNPAPPVPGSQNANSSYKSQAPPPPPLPNHLANTASKSSAPCIPPPPPLPGNLSGTQSNAAGIPPPPPLPTNLQANISAPPPAAAVNSAPRPPPPPMPSGNSQAADSRCALLDQIRQGKNLKKVDRTAQPAANSTSSQSSGDSRDALLDQIRAGKKLKSVDKNQAEKPAPALDTSGLAGALAKALQERSRVLQQTDDSSSDSSDSDSDEEWD